MPAHLSSRRTRHAAGRPAARVCTRSRAMLRASSSQAGKYPHKYAASVDSAREGVRLLRSTDGVTLEPFGPDDWEYIASLCDEEVCAVVRPPGTGAADAEARETLDRFVARTLEQLDPPMNSGATSSPGSPDAGPHPDDYCMPCAGKDTG